MAGAESARAHLVKAQAGREDWPAWASEPVQLTAGDPSWLQRGDDARREVQRAMSGWLTGPVEHIGSTAVAGLVAKPIIDLAGLVADLSCSASAADALGPTWHYVPPELNGRLAQRLLVQVHDGRRATHLHFYADPALLQRQVIFRDVLRTQMVTRTEYAALKVDLAHRYAVDRERYTAAKADFVEAAVRSHWPKV